VLFRVDIRSAAELACILEATARKAGNVHPAAAFDDMTYVDFLRSAVAIGPIMADARRLGVGRTVLEAVRATKRRTVPNTNLGIVLLLAPLAAAKPDGERCSFEEWRYNASAVCRSTTVQDAEDVYEAIRLANPGGLGTSNAQDVRDRPTVTLGEAMTLAAERDSIARQYRDGFAEVFSPHAEALRDEVLSGATLETAIVDRHLRWMAARPDSLIARKWGDAEARECSRQAAELADIRGRRDFDARFAEFDRFLREPNRRRNPGTSADLTTATLFVALACGAWDALRLEFSAPPIVGDRAASRL
jgi:triphosphoribosyl-dephospho-CoA synthase